MITTAPGMRCSVRAWFTSASMRGMSSGKADEATGVLGSARTDGAVAGGLVAGRLAAGRLAAGGLAAGGLGVVTSGSAVGMAGEPLAQASANDSEGPKRPSRKRRRRSKEWAVGK